MTSYPDVELSSFLSAWQKIYHLRARLRNVYILYILSKTIQRRREENFFGEKIRLLVWTVWTLCSDQVLLYWPPICWSNQPLAWQHCYNNVNQWIYSYHHNLSDDERYIKAHQQQRNYTSRKYINVSRKTLQTRCNMWIVRVLLIGSITVFLTCCSVNAHKDVYGMWILVWFYYSISSYTNCVRVCSLPK